MIRTMLSDCHNAALLPLGKGEFICTVCNKHCGIKTIAGHTDLPQRPKKDHTPKKKRFDFRASGGFSKFLHEPDNS